MTNKSQLTAKSKKSIFSGNNNQFNYQAITGMANPKAYASTDRDAIVGGIPVQPQQPAYPQTTLVVGESTDGYLSYCLLDYENKVIKDTVKLPYTYNFENGDYNYIFPLNYGGYMIQLYQNLVQNEYTFVFIDVNGNIVDSHTGSTSANYDTLDGKWVFFVDYVAGIAKIYNGKLLISKTFDTNSEFLFLDWNWDATAKNGSIFIQRINTNTSQAVIIKLDQDGIETEILTYDASNYYYEISQQFTGDFAIFLTKKDSDNSIVNLAVYSHKTKTFVQNIVLIDQVYDDWSYSHYDDNKYLMMVWSSSNSAIDYKIIQYDGNSNTVINASHEKGDNYPYTRIIADSFRTNCTTTGDPKNASILFYHDLGSLGNLYQFDYADFLTFIDGATSPNLYTFSNNELGKYVAINQAVIHEYASLWVLNADSQISVLTLNGTTNPILPLGAYPAVYDEYSMYNYSAFGSNYVSGLYNLSTQLTDAFVINNSGSILDSKLGLSGFSYETSTNLLYLRGDSNTNQGWYINDSVGSFTSIGYYDSARSARYLTEDSYAPRHIILTNSNNSNNKCRILGDTYVTPELVLTTSNSTNFRIGENNFIFWYARPSDGQYVINVYDFEMQLKNSIVTEFNQNSSLSIRLRYFGNRGLVWGENYTNNGTFYYPYLVTPESIVYNEKSTFNSGNDTSVFSFNDIASWLDWTD